MALTDKLTAIADAIRSKTGETATMTLADMPNKISGISGGAEITDGIIIKSRDENGLATSIDVYGDEIYYRQFYGGSQYTASQFTGWNNVQTVRIVSATKIGDFGMGAMQQLQTITGMENVLEIGNKAFFVSGTAANGFSVIAPNCIAIKDSFQESNIIHAEFPNLTQLGNGAFSACPKLTVAKLPKVSRLGIYTGRIFYNCTALTTVEVGSVGYPIIGKSDDSPFNKCIQANLTITAFVKGDFVDTLLANFRNGATNATIILKAAEATTYNGTEFAAGDTIITSTVETEETT